MLDSALFLKALTDKFPTTKGRHHALFWNGTAPLSLQMWVGDEAVIIQFTEADLDDSVEAAIAGIEQVLSEE